MPRERRLIATVTAAGAGMLGLGLGLTACDLYDKTASDTSTVRGAVTSVVLDNEAGSVTVRGDAAAKTTTVHREIRYQGTKPGSASYRFSGDGRLTLSGCGSKCAVGYTVDVPTGVPVSGTNTAGSVHLSDVGAVDVETTSGSVHLERVRGTVTVRTSDGRVSGTGLAASRIDARTSNGSIDLAATTASDVRARSTNGAITLAVPDTGYRLSTASANGDRRIGVRTDPSAEHRLDLTTSNGAITVKPA